MLDTEDKGRMVMGRIWRAIQKSNTLVCNLITIGALQLFKVNRYLPPVGGAGVSVEDEGRFCCSRHPAASPTFGEQCTRSLVVAVRRVRAPDTGRIYTVWEGPVLCRRWGLSQMGSPHFSADWYHW